MWRLTSNAFFTDSPFSIAEKSSQPNSHGTRMRCPLDEIGRNSDRPCTRPRTNAWKIGTARDGTALRSRFVVIRRPGRSANPPAVVVRRSTRRRKPTRLLFVTGGSGYLGRHIVTSRTTERWEIVAPGSRGLDLRNATSVRHGDPRLEPDRDHPHRVPAERPQLDRRRDAARGGGRRGVPGTAGARVDRRRVPRQHVAVHRGRHPEPDHRLRAAQDRCRARGGEHLPRRGDRAHLAAGRGSRRCRPTRSPCTRRSRRGRR